MFACWALWKSAAVGFPVYRICSLLLQLDPPESVTVLLGWDGRVSDLVLRPRLLQAADRTPFSTQSGGSCAK